jgi:hypothetical protein
MSVEDLQQIQAEGVQFTLKPSTTQVIAFFIFIISVIVGFTRYADSKTSAAEVEKIVDQKVLVAIAPIVAQLSTINATLERMEKKQDQQPK